MNEIKCPHCGGMFTIDEAGFAAILKQVRDAEFDKEVRRHEQLLATEKQQAVQLAVAEALGKPVEDVNVCILDRGRHRDLIAAVREAGARIRLIDDGDVFGAIATAVPGTGIDLYMGSAAIILVL